MKTFGIASSALAATKLPDGYEPDAVYLRNFLLNCRQAVKANDIKRRRMLADAVRDMVCESLKETENKLVLQLTNWLDEQAASEDGIDTAALLYGDDGELNGDMETGELSDADLKSLH